jgi:hypothetical protein
MAAGSGLGMAAQQRIGLPPPADRASANHSDYGEPPHSIPRNSSGQEQTLACAPNTRLLPGLVPSVAHAGFVSVLNEPAPLEPQGKVDQRDQHRHFDQRPDHRREGDR